MGIFEDLFLDLKHVTVKKLHLVPKSHENMFLELLITLNPTVKSFFQKNLNSARYYYIHSKTRGRDSR